MDRFRRSLGALPDAAWIHRQLTLDADLVHDLRHGLRMLWKSPGFTVSAVFILAVGIGSTAAVLALLDTLMFRALPYDQAERIVTVWRAGARTFCLTNTRAGRGASSSSATGYGSSGSRAIPRRSMRR